MRNILLLVLLGVFLFIVGNNQFTMFDNSETHGSMVAREIVTLKDPFTMHSNGKPWFVHPPLSFWLQSATCQLFGWTDFNLRLNEAIFGIVGLIVTFMIGRLFLTEAVALAGSLILGTSMYYFVIARMAIFDTILNTFILLAIYFFFKAYLNPQKKGRYFLGYALATVLAVLSKGPIGLVQPGMIIVPFLFFKKDLKFLWDKRVGLNFLLFLALASPWYLYEFSIHGIQFFNVALKDYTWFRFFGVVESQPGPWYYYVSALLFFFPWVFHIPSTLKSGLSHTPRNRDFFLFSWLFIGICFVFFSFAGTKQPNYIISIFPFLSLLMAQSLFETTSKRWVLVEALLTLLFALFLTIAVTKMALPPMYMADRPLLIWFFGIPTVTALVALVGYARNKARGLVTAHVLGTIVWLFFMTFIFFPAIDKYKDSETFVKAIKAEKITNYTLVNFHGYSPYLMYYLDREVKHSDSLDEIMQLLKPSGVYYLIVGKSFNEKIKNLKHITDGYHQSLYRIIVP